MEVSRPSASVGQCDWMALIDLAVLRDRLLRQMAADRADAVIRRLEQTRDAEALRPFSRLRLLAGRRCARAGA